MAVLDLIMAGIGIVVGLIVLVIAMAFLIELVKAFILIGKNKEQESEKEDNKRNERGK